MDYIRSLVISKKALVKATMIYPGLSEIITLHNKQIVQQYIYQLHMQILKQI